MQSRGITYPFASIYAVSLTTRHRTPSKISPIFQNVVACDNVRPQRQISQIRHPISVIRV